MRHFALFFSLILFSAFLFSACTSKKGSTAPDGGGNQQDPAGDRGDRRDQQNPAEGNKWDQMKWDKGKWGFIPKGGVSHV